MSKSALGDLETSLDSLEAGDPILLHDGADREHEVDLIYPAGAVDTQAVARLRNDAGGLICVALGPGVAERFSLPYLADVIDHPVTEDPEIGYDDRSSFSLSVNHRRTYTGVTDADRALTIQRLADAAADPDVVDFATEFRAPGHVHLLRAADGLLAQRQGHTELAIVLARMAGIPEAVVVCEMLDDTTGEALDPTAARNYADRHGLQYLEGAAVIDHRL